ncbi:hypothetical protein GOP47_0029629, partial [Adiantum capillus-veneris]
MGERVCMDTLSLKAVHHLFFAYTPPYMSSCRCCPCMNGRPSSTHHGLVPLLLLDGASLLFDHAALQHLPSALLHPQLPHASPLQAITAARPLGLSHLWSATLFTGDPFLTALLQPSPTLATPGLCKPVTSSFSGADSFDGVITLRQPLSAVGHPLAPLSNIQPRHPVAPPPLSAVGHPLAPLSNIQLRHPVAPAALS